MRRSTGCEGLDEVLGGGLMAGQSYLVAGDPGTGKTILSLQCLRDGLRRGEKTMFITLMEPAAQVARNVVGFGWSLDGIRIVDMSPRGLVDTTAGEEYRMFSPGEVERMNVWKGIYDAIETHRPARLAIDSFTQLRYLSTDEYQFRKHVLQLIAFLNERGCTSLLAYEPSELETERSIELAVDGVLRLRFRVSESLALGMRSIEVTKQRGSDFLSGRHPFRITSRGLQVFPHRIEHAAEHEAPRRLLRTGIASLDELLGGGLESGTTTVLSGPSGVGKSTLGAQILQGLEDGERGVIFTFEESRYSLVERCRSVGMKIDEALASGRLQLRRVNALEIYPDEFLHMLREIVEKDGVRYVMIDSLRGYELAMAEFGKPLAHVHNLLTYLARKGVTTVLVSEAEHIATMTLSATDMGVSHLADNLLLMRYAEHKAQIIKVIGCLKKRIGYFEPELRQLSIGKNGIEVSQKLDRLSGILTGVPVLAGG